MVKCEGNEQTNFLRGNAMFTTIITAIVAAKSAWFVGAVIIGIIVVWCAKEHYKA